MAQLDNDVTYACGCVCVCVCGGGALFKLKAVVMKGVREVGDIPWPCLPYICICMYRNCLFSLYCYHSFLYTCTFT
jgi:hypothetical protein